MGGDLLLTIGQNIKRVRGQAMGKDEIAGELNALIYSGDPFTMDDLMDLVGDGDPFEYL